MKKLSVHWVSLLAAFASCAPAARAQQQTRQPHIGYVFPAGAQRGTVCQVTVGGQFLEGAKSVYVSSGDVTAAVIGYNKPLDGKRFNELRDYIEEARKKLVDAKADAVTMRKFAAPDSIATLLKETGATDNEIKTFLEMRRQRNDPKRQMNVQLDESVTLKIEIAAGAPPGARELRIQTPLGLSNPINFCVGAFPEQTGDGQAGATADTAARVALPVILDGQILPGGVDHFSFEARKGARHCRCSAGPRLDALSRRCGARMVPTRRGGP